MLEINDRCVLTQRTGHFRGGFVGCGGGECSRASLDDVFGVGSALDESALRGIHGGPMWPNMCDEYGAVLLGTMASPVGPQRRWEVGAPRHPDCVSRRVKSVDDCYRRFGCGVSKKAVFCVTGMMA